LTLEAPGIVLITGFEANDPPCRNASAAVIEALQECLPQLRRASGDAEVRIRLMPGNTLALFAALEAALDDLPPPTHLLLLGQAPGRNRITPEWLATNVRDFGMPDRYGNLPRNLPVVEEGPADLHSTWPGQDCLVAALNAAGIPAAMSHDAGTHLCNQLLYLALHAAAQRDQQCVAAFVHVPVLPQQVIDGEPMTVRHPSCPYLPLPMMIDAVTHLLGATFHPKAPDVQASN